MSILFEFDAKNKKSKFLIGTDEAGRGPLAGPVVAAAVCFKKLDSDILYLLDSVNDSKKLTHVSRENLSELIKKYSVYSIVSIDVDEIEKINILQAALKAMRLACNNVADKIGEKVEVFVDGKIKIPNLKHPQKIIVKGDSKSASIAAASILAKVYRDKLMCSYAKDYPDYDWENNKGYGTKKHIKAIKEFGVTPLHRKSFLSKILDVQTDIQMYLNI